MIIKVCGLRDKENLSKIAELDIQMIGLNFYKPSSRYIAAYDEQAMANIPDNIKRVGVFVRSEKEEVLQLSNQYKLDFAQLHGDESVEYCAEIKKHIKVIKVFRVEEGFDFNLVDAFHVVADYFLFDTKTSSYGGSGKQFAWSILDNYQGKTPFLLSGGIGPKDIDTITKINHPAFVGIDINSRFEIAPAIKDATIIKTFISNLNKDHSEVQS